MQILGVQIDKPFLRIALLEKKRNRLEIICLKSPLLEEPESVKSLYTPVFKGKIISGLSAKNLLMRLLDLPKANRRHLEQILAFQSDASSHFDPSEVLLVPFLVFEDKKNIESLLFMASREEIREHLLKLEKVKIDPDIVTITPLALIHYVQWKIPALADAFLIDLGAERCTCVWMEKGRLKKFYSIEGGIEALFAALWEDRKKMIFQKEVKGIAKQIDLLQLKTSLSPHLSAVLHEMRQEMTKIIYSFHRLSGSRPVLFTGNVDAFGHIREYLMESMKEFTSGECNREISTDEQKYAIPIGLALSSLTSPLQFRKEEFFPQKYWKRAGVYSFCSIMLSLLVASLLVCSGMYAIHLRKEEMLQSLSFSLNEEDRLLQKSIFAGKSGEEILDSWAREVAANSKEYPYLQQVPKAAEVLAWLHNHPLVAPMKVKSFRYQLLQFPKIGAPREPSQAKIEIEFSTKNATHARQFHEALLLGDEMVDASQEISWDAMNELYRVSFFLKKRGSHVL